MPILERTTNKTIQRICSSWQQQSDFSHDLNPQDDAPATIKSKAKRVRRTPAINYVALTRASEECLVYLYPEDQ